MVWLPIDVSFVRRKAKLHLDTYNRTRAIWFVSSKYPNFAWADIDELTQIESKIIKNMSFSMKQINFFYFR